MPPAPEGRGSIVNLGSAGGLKWDPTGTGAYAAAKEAVRVLTRTAACEWGADGIRVNAILPLASTPLMDEWADLNPRRTASTSGACRWGVWATRNRYRAGRGVPVQRRRAVHHRPFAPVDGGQAFLR